MDCHKEKKSACAEDKPVMNNVRISGLNCLFLIEWSENDAEEERKTSSSEDLK